MVDHATHARRLRDRAEECRRIAEMQSHAAGRSSYLHLAECYENLAKQEEDLAMRIKAA